MPSSQEAKRSGRLGTNTERLKGLVASGAEPFTADPTDAAGAAKAFARAKAVYVASLMSRPLTYRRTGGGSWMQL